MMLMMQRSEAGSRGLMSYILGMQVGSVTINSVSLRWTEPPTGAMEDTAMMMMMEDTAMTMMMPMMSHRPVRWKTQR